MTTQELEAYIRRNVSSFSETRIEAGGLAFHYTQNAESIAAAGRFLGASVNNHLGQTQVGIQSIPAADPDGVVFAYPTLAVAAHMAPDCRVPFLGPRCYIFHVAFRSAVSAVHVGDQAAEGGESRQLLILVGEVTNYINLGHAADLRGQSST